MRLEKVGDYLVCLLFKVSQIVDSQAFDLLLLNVLDLRICDSEVFKCFQVSVCDLTKYHGNTTQHNACEEDGGQSVDTSALISILITSIAPLPANMWTIVCMDKLGRKFFLGE